MAENEILTNENEYVYKAFISYRHKPLDKAVAQKIHFALEHFKIPKDMQTEKGKNRLGKVFRDEEELPASGNLSESISYALEHSEFLIVICTPDTPGSIWVRQEISRFKQLHGYDHIVAVLANGTPDESFPEELVTVDDPDNPGQTVPIEPLAANMTDMSNNYDKSRFKREVVRLYAAILGCTYDSLWQREHRYKMRKGMLIVSAVSAVMLAFAISMLIKNREISSRNEMIEKQNVEIKNRNDEIESRNKEIEKQNSELTLKEAEARIREAELLIDNGDNEKAIASVLSAVSSEEGAAAYGDKAELLLSESLGAGLFENAMRRYSSVSLDNDVTEILISDSNDCFYTADSAGLIRCFTYPDLSEKWRSNSIDMSLDTDDAAKRRNIVEIYDEGILLYMGEKAVTALSVTDGSLKWQLENSGAGITKCCALSEDMKTFAAVTSTPDLLAYRGGPPYKVTVLDTASGKVQSEIPLPEEYDDKNIYAVGNNMVFSPDGNYLAFTAYFQFGEDAVLDGYHMCTLFTDLQKEEIKTIYDEAIVTSFFADYPAVIGMKFTKDSGSVYVMDYDIDGKCVRIRRNYPDGKVQDLYSHSQNMFDKYITDSVDYMGMEMSGDSWITAYCDNVSYFRIVDPENEGYGATEYEGVILYHDYMDDDHTSRLVITDDGRQQAVYTGDDGGTVVQDFLDMKHITDLDLTDGFARNLSSEFGHTIDEDAWGIALCDDDSKKVSLLKPAIDPHVKKLDIEDRMNKYSIQIRPLDDDHVAIYGQIKDSEDFVIYVYDLKERCVSKTYEIDKETADEMYHSRYSDLVMDAENDRYYDVSAIFSGGRIWSLKDFSNKPMFDRHGISIAYGAQTGGGYIFSSLVQTEDYDFSNPKFEISWTDGNGEASVVENTNDYCFGSLGNYDCPPRMIIGRSGYIITCMFDKPDSPVTKAFMLYDTVTGEECVIDDLCPGNSKRIIEPADSGMMFATSDDDSHIRIYSAKENGLLRDIDLTSLQETVASLDFCLEDKVLAVWTANAHLELFDLDTGALLYDEYTDIENRSMNDNRTIEMSVSENREKNRLYFTFSSGQCIILNSTTFSKTALLPIMEMYCPASNEFLIINGEDIGNCGEVSGVYSFPSYTHDELLDWAQNGYTAD